MGFEDVQGFQQQVAEVSRVQRLQPLLIHVIECLALAEGVTLGFAFRDIAGPQSAIFPAVDHAGQCAGWPALLVHAFGLDQLLHQPQLVVGVEDGEIAFQTRQLGMAAQHPGADGMEGSQPLHTLNGTPNECADALLHFARRLVGESDAEDLPRPCAAGGKNVGEAGGQHAGLAGARAGQHQHRAVHRFHRGALLGVQPVQIDRIARHGRG